MKTNPLWKKVCGALLASATLLTTPLLLSSGAGGVAALAGATGLAPGLTAGVATGVTGILPAGSPLSTGLSLGLSRLAAMGTAQAASGPSVDQVDAAIARGDMTRAQQLLDEVIAAHPNSARAHYLDAQVLERNHRYADAQTQMQAARRLDPNVGFTDPATFARNERRIAGEAGGNAGSRANPGSNNYGSSANNAAVPVMGAAAGAMTGTAAGARTHHGMGLWMVLLLLVIVAVVALIWWSMRKRNADDDAGATDVRRAQLKQATDLQQTVRGAKLDLKLSASPNKDAWLAEADELDASLRTVIDRLTSSSGGGAASPDSSVAYQLENLAQRVDRIKALADGRPDPGLPGTAAPTDNRSPYAAEADRMSGANGGYPNAGYPNSPYPNQQPTQQVIVQQAPSMGGGGLLTGLLMGEMLSGHHDREVIVEHDRAPQNAPDQQNAQNDPNNQNGGFDFGTGSDNWGDDNGGGGIDTADNGNDDNWDS